MLFINVPFSEKDEAKSLGAKWNPERKKWFVEDKKNYPKFKKWILSDDEGGHMILCDHYYIVVGLHTCFKCKKQTEVIGFGIENFYEMYDVDEGDNDKGYEYYQNEIHIGSQLEPLPENMLSYLNTKYKYYNGYSKTTDSNYFGNHCIHCGVLQGNWHIFDEVDSPFFIENSEAASALKLFKVTLKEDFKASCEIGYGSEDYLIKKCAQITSFDEKLL